MKIVILNNSLDNIGGAEIVSLTLARELNADLYTTNIDIEKIKKVGFVDVLPRIFSIGRIPKKSPFRQQLALLKFRYLNLSNKYDFFIISGDWAMSSAVNNHPNIWYVHSPLNELWQFKNFVRNDMLDFWQKPFFDIWVWFNRKLTIKYSKYVDNWVCNSENTKRRIKRFYNEEAVIINPPIYTSKYNYKEDCGYWLSVNRMVPHKRIEIQIEAFSKMPKEKLIIVASYEKGVKQFEEYKNKIEKIKPSNVLIKYWVTEEDLLDLYANCRGFIATTRDEDFGMTIVEAMSAGKTVVYSNDGGHKESVSGEAGIPIDNINADKLCEIISGVKIPLNKNYVSIERAKKFDTSVFVEKIKQVLEKYE